MNDLWLPNILRHLAEKVATVELVASRLARLSYETDGNVGTLRTNKLPQAINRKARDGNDQVQAPMQDDYIPDTIENNVWCNNRWSHSCPMKTLSKILGNDHEDTNRLPHSALYAPCHEQIKFRLGRRNRSANSPYRFRPELYIDTFDHLWGWRTSDGSGSALCHF